VSQRLVELDTTTDAATATITLNRADKRNALSIQLLDELLAAVTSASADLTRRVLILRGNGPAFCAGLDLKEAADARNNERSARALAGVYQAIAQSSLVTIAAVHGAVMGGGIGLMAACDLVLAADNTSIAFPEVRRGLVAALVTALVQRQVADRTLRELVLLGQTISANQAMSIGLVNRVVPLHQLQTEAHGLAAHVLQGAPNAIVRTKRLLAGLFPHPISAGLDYALQYHLQARDDAESAEGIAAFLARRPPVWGPRRA
jgi:methylglutaconyl-CoA hydratase